MKYKKTVIALKINFVKEKSSRKKGLYGKIKTQKTIRKR